MTSPDWPLPSMRKLLGQLVEQYPKHRAADFANRRFKHVELQKHLEHLEASQFEVKVLGRSFQQREIYLVKWGIGPKKILFWSQMHGNEATATLALIDLWSFLVAPGIQHGQDLHSKLSLYFIPMLNPDGAQLFHRRTAMAIDMNRDARRLECPESRLLKDFAEKLRPDFAFNLHDQNNYYTPGDGPATAALSFLAPAYDQSKAINTSRREAMQLIGGLAACLQPLLKGRIGRYDDAYEPRAFGELMQSSGIRTILVESGAWPDDPEKQYIRELNFLALVLAVRLIADNTYQKIPESHYWEIPQNQSNLHDLVIRRLEINSDEHSPYHLDVAIRREELDHRGNLPLYHRGLIEDLGDLSSMHGYEELDGKDLHYLSPKVFPEIFDSVEQAGGIDPMGLMKQGYTGLRVRRLPETTHSYPLDLLNENAQPNWDLEPEKPASFLLADRDQIRHAVINGFLYPLTHDSYSNWGNGWYYH